VAVADSAPQAETRSALFVESYAKISTDTELRVGLSAIAELLIQFCFPSFGLKYSYEPSLSYKVFRNSGPAEVDRMQHTLSQ